MERLPDALVINAYTGLIIGRLCQAAIRTPGQKKDKKKDQNLFFNSLKD